MFGGGIQMLRRPLYGLIAISLLFTVGSVAASVINLSGSDPAPGEGTTTGHCATNITVSAPPTNANGNDKSNDLKVVHVYVSGNFSACTGGWMRVTAQINPSQWAYAVTRVNTSVQDYTFTFDRNIGDFYSDTPTWANNQFTSHGNLVGPQNKLDVSEISVVVAKSWE